MGYDVSGNIRKFDSDGTLDEDDGAGTMDYCFFMNFSRLLVKDEIKKNSFRMQLYNSGTLESMGGWTSNQSASSPSYVGTTDGITIGDYNSANEFRTSPAGDYGLIFTASSTTGYPGGSSVGLMFYQAGVLVLTSSLFGGALPTSSGSGPDTGSPRAQGRVEFGPPNFAVQSHATTGSMTIAQTGSTIESLSQGLRHRLIDVDFNNTIELNSAIYFCRVNHNEFNYSSNPTYVTGSKLIVKNNINDLPVTYITSVGLYSPDNELLAVAKLSEPIRKDPNTELSEVIACPHTYHSMGLFSNLRMMMFLRIRLKHIQE